MAAEFKIEGFDHLAAKLRAIVPAMRKRVLRNALAAGGRIVRDRAKQLVPKLDYANRQRKPGTVKDAIRVRTSKIARRSGDVGVFINVKPAPAGHRGAKSPHDPYYWRFLEFGTRKMRARPFLTPTAGQFPRAVQVFTAQVGRWIEKTNSTGRLTP